jgi:hypothetical protein
MGIVGKGYSYLDQTSECNYLTHIVFRLFEHLDKGPTDPTKYRVELLLSPGVTTDLSSIGIFFLFYIYFFIIKDNREKVHSWLFDTGHLIRSPMHFYMGFRVK